VAKSLVVVGRTLAEVGTETPNIAGSMLACHCQ
jgi:hypothetical protein